MKTILTKFQTVLYGLGGGGGEGGRVGGLLWGL
jgi:hypothetical protein